MNEAWNQAVGRTGRYALGLLFVCLLTWSGAALAEEGDSPSMAVAANSEVGASRFAAWLEDLWEVTRLEPGQRVERSVRFSGDLDRSRKLEVWRGDLDRGPDAPHACLRVFYGADELPYGEANALRVPLPVSGTTRVMLKADTDCGWTEDTRKRAVPLLFRTEGEAETQTVQWLYTLHNPLQLEDQVTLTVPRGAGLQRYDWGPMWAGDWPRQYQATLDLEATSTPLPSGLSIRMRATIEDEEGKADEPSNTHTITVSSEDTQLPLRFDVAASPCTAPGTYVVPVRLTLLHEDGSTGRGRTTMLALTVTGSGLRCWWPRFALAAVALLLLSLLAGALRRRGR